jgi:hypothetical protein
MTKYAVFFRNDCPDIKFDPELTRKEIIHSKRFTGVCTVDAKSLHDVFSKMQASKWSPTGETTLTKKLKLNHISMIAGDVIYDTAKDVYFQVDMLGFAEVK